MIGKLTRRPLREVWKDEAKDFTPWLVDNLDVLNEVLDLNLASAEREQTAGDFSVDLVAEDDAGNVVVIENQLNKSDHDHLGKLITYLTAVDAKTAIWIVADPRPEHVRAITWLNESASAAFFLLKVEAVSIEGSPAAPLLTLIVGPSAETREAGETKKELAERYDIRERFWTSLLEIARNKTKLHANISPCPSGWVGAGAGKGGLAFNYSVRQHDMQVELYIARGTDAQLENKAIFDQLLGDKDEIEKVFGDRLEWQKLEGRLACRIRKVIDIGGYRDEAKWPEIHETATNAMVRLEKAFTPYIAKLKV